MVAVLEAHFRWSKWEIAGQQITQYAAAGDELAPILVKFKALAAFYLIAGKCAP